MRRAIIHTKTEEYEIRRNFFHSNLGKALLKATLASIVTLIVMLLVGRYNLDGRLVNRGRASSVGRALDCRVGGRGLKTT